MEGATVIDDIKRTEFGDFILTEERLKELLEAEVTTRAANELGLYDGVNWRDILAFMYPDEGETPYAVADSLVASIG